MQSPSRMTPGPRPGSSVASGGRAGSSNGSPRSKLRYGAAKDKCGYLRKEGRTLRLKKRRFLNLSGQTLSHHREEGTAPTWSLDVKNIAVLSGPRNGELLIIYEGRTVSFFTQDLDDLADWVGALKRARANLEDWYRVDKEIGRGSYGTVFLGQDRETEEKVAVKIILKNPTSKRQTKFLEREIKIMQSVDHPNVIVTVDVFEDDKQVALVSEFIEGGELFDRIISDKAFTEDKAREVTRQILSGINHLHSLQIVHRDIKPENVLCTRDDGTNNLQIKLTDFGLSNIMDEGADSSAALLSHVGTSFYLAPEVVGREGYGPGVDIWATGVVLYIMLCGRFPFWGKSDIEYLASLRRGPDLTGEEWDRVSPEGKTFVRTLLDLDPTRRPSAQEALLYPWFVTKSDGKPNLNRLESVAGIAAVRDKTHQERQKIAETMKAAEAQAEEASSPTAPADTSFTGFDSD